MLIFQAFSIPTSKKACQGEILGLRVICVPPTSGVWKARCEYEQLLPQQQKISPITLAKAARPSRKPRMVAQCHRDEEADVLALVALVSARFVLKRIPAGNSCTRRIASRILHRLAITGPQVRAHLFRHGLDFKGLAYPCCLSPLILDSSYLRPVRRP